MEASTQSTTEGLERELERLLEQDGFEPPADLRERALLTDYSTYDEAAREPVGWWEMLTDALAWFE